MVLLLIPYVPSDGTDLRLADRERPVTRLPGEAIMRALSILEGLAKPQKTLPSAFFYDEIGSQLFDQICDLPEYYPTPP